MKDSFEHFEGKPTACGEGGTAPGSDATTRDFEGELLVVLQIQPRVTIERVLDIMAAAAAWQVEGRTATLQAENTRLRESFIFANELLAVHNLQVCDQHTDSWKLDYRATCPRCERERQAARQLEATHE